MGPNRAPISIGLDHPKGCAAKLRLCKLLHLGVINKPYCCKAAMQLRSSCYARIPAAILQLRCNYTHIGAQKGPLLAN